MESVKFTSKSAIGFSPIVVGATVPRLNFEGQEGGSEGEMEIEKIANQEMNDINLEAAYLAARGVYHKEKMRFILGEHSPIYFPLRERATCRSC